MTFRNLLYLSVFLNNISHTLEISDTTANFPVQSRVNCHYFFFLLDDLLHGIKNRAEHGWRGRCWLRTWAHQITNSVFLRKTLSWTVFLLTGEGFGLGEIRAWKLGLETDRLLSLICLEFSSCRIYLEFSPYTVTNRCACRPSECWQFTGREWRP